MDGAILKLAPCEGHNSGTCSVKAGERYPANSNKVHKCSKCGSIRHGYFGWPQVSLGKTRKQSYGKNEREGLDHDAKKPKKRWN